MKRDWASQLVTTVQHQKSGLFPLPRSMWGGSSLWIIHGTMYEMPYGGTPGQFRREPKPGPKPNKLATYLRESLFEYLAVVGPAIAEHEENSLRFWNSMSPRAPKHGRVALECQRMREALARRMGTT